MTIRLRGMTWDHPRGFDPLIAGSERYREQTGVEVVWEKRSLQGFESFPVEELARAYDLIVIDHPHVGQVSREGCLVAFDEADRERDRRALLAASVGLSYHSYRYGGRLWALPLDAAAQVQAVRPDRLDEAPQRWSDVIKLAQAGRVTLALRPPHSLMCLMSLAANLGWEPGWPGEAFLPAQIGEPTLEGLSELVAHLDGRCFAADPIATLDELAGSDHLSCTPLVYGYVSYARSGFRANRLSFVDMPCVGSAGPMGSVLGGTGIAVSRFSDAPDAARSFAYWIASETVQRGLYVAGGGQPGHGAAWTDPEVNRLTSDFFTGTRATLEGAMLRPRHDGYMAFQDLSSRMLTEALANRHAPRRILSDINELWRKTHPETG